MPDQIIDPVSLSWVDSQIKDLRDQFEKRLLEDREFIKSVLGLAVKICGASLILILGIIGFFGYKDIASIDEKINKSVSEKIKEKSEEFKLIYEKNIQGLTDQASVTAYLLQFSAPQKAFDRPTILATHLQRFVQILSEENSDSKITDAIYDLLSNPERDDRSALVDNRLRELVSAKGSFSWIKKSPARLARAIDLLRNRNIFDQPAPVLVRPYLSDDDSSLAIRRSAILYAEAAKDQGSLPSLVKLLGDKNKSLSRELIFAVASLDPTNKWISDWIGNLRKGPAGRDVREFHEDLILAARVGSLLMTSAAKSAELSFSNRTLNPRAVEFAAASISMIIENDGHVQLRREFGSDSSGNEPEVSVSWDQGTLYGVQGANLFLNEGGLAVVTELCRTAIARSGTAGLSHFLKATSSKNDAFSDIKYSLYVNLKKDSEFSVSIDGTASTISDTLAQISTPTDAEDMIRVNWRTNDGLTKTGSLTDVQKIGDAVFSFRVSKDSLE